MSELVTYADIAELMGVTIGVARQRSFDDDRFPQRANPTHERPALFDADSVAHYIKVRNTRTGGRAGRPTNAASQKAGVPITNAAEVGTRIRTLMAAPAAPIADVRTLARALGLEPHALRFRLRGQTKWREHELAAIARAYNVSIDDLLATRLPID